MNRRMPRVASQSHRTDRESGPAAPTGHVPAARQPAPRCRHRPARARPPRHRPPRPALRAAKRRAPAVADPPACGLLGEAPAAREIADHLATGMNRCQGHGPDDVALLVLHWKAIRRRDLERFKGTSMPHDGHPAVPESDGGLAHAATPNLDRGAFSSARRSAVHGAGTCPDGTNHWPQSRNEGSVAPPTRPSSTFDKRSRVD